MAKIDWTGQFLRQLDANIEYASIEYGHATAIRWAEEIAAFENRVQKHPTSYTIESLLNGKKCIYRRCHLMNCRFKIIYYYDEVEDIVHLIDIWDTRMDPKVLVRRIK
jgi:mRNA-degrading endonuclease YafQ of YafQ-DinJ toxin-antitoxin module